MASQIEGSSHSASAAPLAFHDLVSLLQGAFALAILALLLLLDVRAFFIRHRILRPNQNFKGALICVNFSAGTKSNLGGPLHEAFSHLA